MVAILLLFSAVGQDALLVNDSRCRAYGHHPIEGSYLQLDHASLRVTFCYPEETSALEVRGGAILSDGLRVRFNYFEPTGGERFEIIKDAAFLRGRFTRVELPRLPEGLTARLVYDDLATGRDLDQDGKYDVTLVIDHPRS